MRGTLVFLILVLAAAAAVADHHTEGKPAMNGPDPMLRQLEFFTGKWQCSGMAGEMPGSPAHATQAEVDAKWGVGGYWVPITYSEKKTAENANPFTFTGFFGYDRELKKFVVGGVDSMGGYSTGASDGWNGDTMVFAGPWHMNGMTANARDTFTRKGDKQMVHKGEIEMDGKWIQTGEETCTRR